MLTLRILAKKYCAQQKWNRWNKSWTVSVFPAVVLSLLLSIANEKALIEIRKGLQNGRGGFFHFQKTISFLVPIFFFFFLLLSFLVLMNFFLLHARWNPSCKKHNLIPLRRNALISVYRNLILHKIEKINVIERCWACVPFCMWRCTAKGLYKAPTLNQMNKTPIYINSNINITRDFSTSNTWQPFRPSQHTLQNNYNTTW